MTDDLLQQALIEIEDVTVKRQQQALLDGVDWRTEKGQHWALLGANGSGKTTLLQTILGYLWPTTGTVHALGHRLGAYDVRELRKKIGFVSSNMDARMEQGDSARAIVATGRLATYGLYDKPDEADMERAAALLDDLAASHVADQPYHTLSQGEKQKVLIARALMADPELLILDEPCNGLDFPSRERLQQAIETIGRQASGPQLIYVTHYPDEIVPTISHVMVLAKGSVVASGEKRDVLSDDVLSRAFSVPVHVMWHDDYPIVRVRR